MKPVTDSRWLQKSLQAVKSGGGRLITNLFASDEILKCWLQRGHLFCIEAPQSILVFRQDADFFHLYFASAGLKAMQQSLTAATADNPHTIVADLVGSPTDVAMLVAEFEFGGFQRLTILERMVLNRPSVEGAGRSAHNASLAEPADAETILGLLQTNFNRYAEQLPTLEEIVAAINKRNILIVRIADQIAGFLYFEIVGYTAKIRYWFVGPAFRNDRIGSRLMRAFMECCTGIRRIVLWVKANNDNAIEKYQHYGFVRDNLVDQVMIKQGSSA